MDFSFKFKCSKKKFICINSSCLKLNPKCSPMGPITNVFYRKWLSVYDPSLSHAYKEISSVPLLMPDRILTQFRIIIYYLYSINHICMFVNLPVDLWFMQQVNLILNQNHGYVSAFVLNFSFPFFDGLEGGMIGCRKRDHAGLCSPIISFSDSIKLFLASSVPKHESDIFPTCPEKYRIVHYSK